MTLIGINPETFELSSYKEGLYEIEGKFWYSLGRRGDLTLNKQCPCQIATYPLTCQEFKDDNSCLEAEANPVAKRSYIEFFENSLANTAPFKIYCLDHLSFLAPAIEYETIGDAIITMEEEFTPAFKVLFETISEEEVKELLLRNYARFHFIGIISYLRNDLMGPKFCCPFPSGIGDKVKVEYNPGFKLFLTENPLLENLFSLMVDSFRSQGVTGPFLKSKTYYRMIDALEETFIAAVKCGKVVNRFSRFHKQDKMASSTCQEATVDVLPPKEKPAVDTNTINEISNKECLSHALPNTVGTVFLPESYSPPMAPFPMLLTENGDPVPVNHKRKRPTDNPHLYSPCHRPRTEKDTNGAPTLSIPVCLEATNRLANNFSQAQPLTVVTSPNVPVPSPSPPFDIAVSWIESGKPCPEYFYTPHHSFYEDAPLTEIFLHWKETLLTRLHILLEYHLRITSLNNLTYQEYKNYVTSDDSFSGSGKEQQILLQEAEAIFQETINNFGQFFVSLTRHYLQEAMLNLKIDQFDRRTYLQYRAKLRELERFKQFSPSRQKRIGRIALIHFLTAALPPVIERIKAKLAYHFTYFS